MYTDPAAVICSGSRYGGSFTTRRFDKCFLRPRNSFPLECCSRFFSAIEFSVGSVGTWCWVLLLMAREGDPLFLQVKEARTSVLEPYAGASVFPNHGQRVVNGYRLMQPASDMFLGWTQGPKRHFFLRQLRDIKISIRVETFGAPEMDLYASWCGRALALSHARSGSSMLLSGYMGKSDTFDRAIADFSVAYADQNEKDHSALERAVRKGKVKAVFEEER